MLIKNNIFLNVDFDTYILDKENIEKL